jgi:DNA topoisomerase-3
MTRILCVAEKPSIAKAVANHLGGQARAVSLPKQQSFRDGLLSKFFFFQENVQGIQFVKNYKFDYNFQRWGQSSVTFTSVIGHIQEAEFHDRYRKWMSCQPSDLFDAPIQIKVASVSLD